MIVIDFTLNLQPGLLCKIRYKKFKVRQCFVFVFLNFLYYSLTRLNLN